MIESLFYYKKNVFEQMLKSEIISESEKRKAIEEYKDFVRKCVVIDSQGRLVVNSYLIKELKKAIYNGNIPLVMTKKDLAITVGDDLPNSEQAKGKVFKTGSDFVAIHVSPIPPEDDMIKTAETTGLMSEMLFVDPSTGVQHKVPYLVGNDTIHFTLNCVVHNHEVGNDWDSYPYGIFISLDGLCKEKILDLKSEDTYVDGDAELGSDYFLFCPFGEKEEMIGKNPHATVIEYDGISLKDALSAMIILTGRKLEPYGTYGWGKNTEFGRASLDVGELESFATHNDYPVLKGKFGYALHSETKYMARRMWKREYEALINLLEYNQKNNIDMPDDVLLLVMMYGGAFSLPGSVPVSVNDYKEVVVPILRKHGYFVGDELFEGIVEDNDMKLIYSEEGSNFPNVRCPNWETELRNRVIEFLKNHLKKKVVDTNKPKLKL